MLTVAKITTGSAGGYAAYLEGRAQPSELGDYYLTDGDRVEAPGRWAAGAESVGMNAEQAVTGEQLRTLMAVRRPDSGQPLRRAGATGQVAALDATFSAPKSVSVLWAVADPALRTAVEGAHEAAIDRALALSVREVAMIRRRVDGEVVHTRATDLIATSWRHTTARAVPGQLPDPQLHSHVLLHGAKRADGELVAIDSRRWLQHRRELGAAYRTELAHGLHELGFTITRGTGRAGRYFEIGGIPQELIDRWSSRHHEVRRAIDAQLADQQRVLEAEARQGGPVGERAAASLRRLRADRQLTPRQDRQAAINTRTAKHDPTVTTHHDLDRTWQATGDQHGVTTGRLGDLRDREPRHLGTSDDLPARLTEFDARFTWREARAAALEASAGVAIEEAIGPLLRMRETGELLELADGTLTTRAHRAREHATYTLIHKLADGCATPIDPDRVDREVQRLDQRLASASGTGEGLTVQQRDAIELVCSERQLSVIEGHAGTGKSTVLSAAARAHQASGQRILVTSTAALAARRLADDLTADGVDCHAHSTAALHAAIQSGRERLGPGTTVIHDEAALASTREQHHLFSAIKDSGARLIEVGDPAQSQPVGAGGLWTDIHNAAARTELTCNVRAQDPEDRLAQRMFRDGMQSSAIHDYADRGHVHISETDTQAENHALTAAQTDRRAGLNVLTIAQTSNTHLDELNARAQALRHHDGEITGPGMPLPGRPYELHAGDEIQIRRSLTHPDAGTIHNGTTGRVTAVDPDREHIALQLSEGRDITLERDQVAAGDLRLAYVQHPFPAQGTTTDTTHLIHTDQSTQEGNYVALTRARQHTTIHTPHLTHDPDATEDQRHQLTLLELGRQMGRSEPDIPSIQIPLAHEHDITHQLDTTIDHAAGTAAEIEPAAHLTRGLGDRPQHDDPRRDLWDHAAEQITAYRARHDIPNHDPLPLGPRPAAGQFTERLAHQQATKAMAKAARSLGHSPNAYREPERSRETGDGGYEP